MTDKTIPDVSDDERELADKVRAILAKRDLWAIDMITEIEAVLQPPPPPRPTLAGMTPKERAECQWMQADTETWGRAVIVLPNTGGGGVILLDRCGDVIHEDHARITPRPDLPRLEWPGDTHTPTPATLTVGSVWENAAALDEAALESGRDQITVTDCDGDVYVWDANLHDWRDLHPIPNYAPFTILHTGRKAADATD